MEKEDLIRIAKECFNDENWEHLEKSFYNNNYYKCSNGYEVFAKSDDDNTTDYYLVVNSRKYGFQFAYSLTSDDDKLIWYVEE